MPETRLIIGGDNQGLVSQSGRMCNRHGLVAGATGTGKTVTLQVLAEGFSRMGTPVFAVDVKGDLSGLAAPGKPHPKIDERLSTIPLPDYRQQPCPTLLWDMEGAAGHDHTRLFDALLGTNLGPLVTMWGSLATLLWAERCRAHGIRIAPAKFAALGLGGVPVLLLGSWAALHL